MTSAPPFRTHVQISNPESPESRKMMAIFDAQAVDQTLSKIKRSANGPIDELVELARLHPDERIAIAVIRQWKSKLDRRDLWAFYLRGHQICESEGIVWHPLFDALQCNACWPDKALWDEADAQKAYCTVQEQIAPLISWIESQTDPGAVMSLLQFRAYPIREAVARHARIVPEEAIRHLPIKALAGNPNLPDSWAHQIAEEAIAILAESRRFYIPLRQNPNRLFSSISSPFTAHLALEGLAKAGRQLSSELMDRLVDEIVAQPHRSAYIGLLTEFGTQVSEKHLEKIIQRTDDDHVWHDVITHPSATKPFQLEVLEKAQGITKHKLCLRISSRASFLNDPDIRSQILSTSAERTLMMALATAVDLSQEIFVEVLDRCIDEVPRRLAQIVSEQVRSSSFEEQWKTRVQESYLSHLIERLAQRNQIQALEILSLYEPAAQNPRLQEALIDSYHTHVVKASLYRIIPYVSPERFRRLFRKFANTQDSNDFEAFINFLLQRYRDRLANLEAEDYQKLLLYPNMEIRLEIIRILGHKETAPTQNSGNHDVDNTHTLTPKKPQRH